MTLMGYPGAIPISVKPLEMVEDAIMRAVEYLASKTRAGRPHPISVVVIPADLFAGLVSRLNARVEDAYFTQVIRLYTANGFVIVAPGRAIYA